MQFVRKKIAILGSGEEAQDLLGWLKLNSQACQIKVIDPFTNQDLRGWEIVFRSPGIWRLHSRLLEAEAVGVQISSATKLFFQLCPCPIIGVTGTKGKGTTASLITQILKDSGKNIYLAGNIGKPMLSLLKKLQPDGLVCLELSSFQLQDLEISPHVAVILNVTQDHLDVHQNLKEYRQAKENIVRHQQVQDHAVINHDYPVVRAYALLTPAKTHWFSGKSLKLDHSCLKLRGEHNLENIAAAMAVGQIFAVPQIKSLKTVYAFKGLEHRLELVRKVKGVSFYNDSFSTTPETAIAAIKSFSEPLILILGGSDKGSDYRSLGKVICQSPNLKAVILIGKMGPVIGREIKNYQGRKVKGGRNMLQIIKQARQLAVSGDAVVLSPACASFDMFHNYKDRGDQFKTYVNQLS